MLSGQDSAGHRDRQSAVAGEYNAASLGIFDWFQAIVGAESVVHPKPAPDCFLRAAELIGVKPESCHAFEDAELGMLAAQRAGMQVTHVRTLMQAEPGCTQ